jgi:hypothetical protein
LFLIYHTSHFFFRCEEIRGERRRSAHQEDRPQGDPDAQEPQASKPRQSHRGLQAGLLERLSQRDSNRTFTKYVPLLYFKTPGLKPKCIKIEVVPL